MKDLRDQAELILKNRPLSLSGFTGDQASLLHELSTHQIELELQNEELKLSRDEAEIATEKYFRLYDLAPVGYAGFARDGTIAHINLTGTAILGADRRDCIGRRFEVFVSQDDIPVFSQFIRRVYMSGRKESCEISLGQGPRRDVTVVKIEGYILEEPETENLVCNAAIIDVTRQRRAEQDLLETSHYLETLLDFANSPIVVWDSNMMITRFNHAFERLSGRPASSVIGKPFPLLIPESHRESILAFFRSSGGRDFEGVEIPITSLDNGERILLWTAATITGQDGLVRSTIAQGQDITDRKNREKDLRTRVEALNTENVVLTAIGKELKEQDDRLKESLAEKEILLAEVHHMVTDNLTSFISLMNLESGTDDHSAGRELREDLRNRAGSMALIHDALYRTPQTSNIDMNDYLKPVVKQIVSSYPTSHPIATIIHAEGIVMDIDRATSVGMIISELVTNSLKHAFPEGSVNRGAGEAPGTIGVTLTRSEGFYLLRVSDNGVGLRAGFNPLSAKSLGLKLVNFLAKHKLKANIRVDSGEGTVFVLRFPEGRGA